MFPFGSLEGSQLAGWSHNPLACQVAREEKRTWVSTLESPSVPVGVGGWWLGREGLQKRLCGVEKCRRLTDGAGRWAPRSGLRAHSWQTVWFGDGGEDMPRPQIPPTPLRPDSVAAELAQGELTRTYSLRTWAQPAVAPDANPNKPSGVWTSLLPPPRDRRTPHIHDDILKRETIYPNEKAETF